MSQVFNGFMGPFVGKVGTGVGTFVNGRNLLRSRPIIRKKATETQESHRALFRMCANFLEPITGLLKKSYTRLDHPDIKSYNQALKQVMDFAISGTPPVINYSLVEISRGKLNNAETFNVIAATGSLTFTWTNNADGDIAFLDDKAILVAYCESLKRYAFTTNGAARGTGTAVLNLPAAFNGNVLHTWMAFISADGKKSATSIYTGAVTPPANP